MPRGPTRYAGRMRRVVLFVVALASCTSVSGDGGTVDAGTSSSSSSDTNAETTTTESTDDSTTANETDTNTTETETDTDTDTETDTGEPGASLGVFDLTYYWVAYEGDYFGPADTVVGECDGTPLATVPLSFANALKLEGSGKLLDERILNIGGCGCGGGYDCFAQLDPMRFPWGQGSQGNPLVPFVTIATDTSVLPFGTAVYVPSLAGVMLPDGGTHDGCLSAGDVGGGIDGMHIDWFVGLQDNYQVLDPEVPETVELFEGGTLCP
jgi:hypothetical protein